jgi:TolA-binding protein
VARGKDNVPGEGDHEKLILEDLGSGDLSLQDLSFREKALFLEGKSYANLNYLTEAMAVFKRLFGNNPGSPFADDALFEYAGILAEKGEVDRAAEKYYELWETYRSSSLADEALYKRGELFFNNKLYTKSRQAFQDYRTQYPEGNLVDAAIFWEGQSAYELGEMRSASLMWEKIIKNYRNSPFRPDAMHKTAEAYVSHGDFQKAIDLYEELKIMYPEYSRALNVDLRSDEIRYLVLGFSEREAELTAIISKNSGPETREGRSAMIALARIYIFEEEGKLERAFQMLSQVLERNDPETGADAQFLLGEYYHRNEEYEKAGKAFFRASLLKPEDRDFMAYSIYRAAGMMKLAGKNREVKALVERLDQNFSGSEWAEEGKKLLEGVN